MPITTLSVSNLLPEQEQSIDYSLILLPFIIKEERSKLREYIGHLETLIEERAFHLLTPDYIKDRLAELSERYQVIQDKEKEINELTLQNISQSKREEEALNEFKNVRGNLIRNHKLELLEAKEMLFTYKRKKEDISHTHITKKEIKVANR